MKLTISVLVFFAGLVLNAATDEIGGTWKTVMVDPCVGGRPCPAHGYQPTFDFKVEGGKLTGSAHMEAWPGDTELSNGKVDGNRVTFTVTHEMTYSGVTGTHHPEFKCEGTIDGNEMELTMVRVDTDGRAYEMKGTRISK